MSFEIDKGLRMNLCSHLFVDGFGGMGDAVVCCKCGLDKYPEAIPLVYALALVQGRVIKEGHPTWNAYAELAIEARKKTEVAT